MAQPAVQLLQRAASRQAASITARKDPRSIHPPGFIARPQPADIEKRGSDALPTDGMQALWERVFLWRADDAVIFEKREESVGCRRGIC